MKKVVCALVVFLFTFCCFVSVSPSYAFAVDEDNSALSFDEEKDQEEMNADEQFGEELDETRMEFSSEDDEEVEARLDESVMPDDATPEDPKTK